MHERFHHDEWVSPPAPELPEASAGAAARKPVLTALLLASGTLCVSGIIATILPAASGSPIDRDYVSAPVAAVVQSPAAERVAALESVDARAVLPRVMERFAVTAAEAVARMERRMDEHAKAAPAEASVAFATPGTKHATRPAPAPQAAPAVATTRVVYLVDASGSLLDSLPQVIDWLGESLDGLAQGQQFTVLFFREGQVFEAPPRGLKPASFAAKASVWTWMQPERGNVSPRGRSDLFGAIEAAMGYRPDELYIVSDDSFNRSASAARSEDGAILQRVSTRLGATPPMVHTVQFFYRDEAGALEAIADRFGGTYRFIEPAERTTAAVTDPLIELSIIN